MSVWSVCGESPGPSDPAEHLLVMAQCWERSDFIPDKCFLPFRGHGLARVQPQTQCTIMQRPERKGQRKKKEGKKRHLEFKIQITVSIKETGTREHILVRPLNYWGTGGPRTFLPFLKKSANGWQSVLRDDCTGPSSSSGVTASSLSGICLSTACLRGMLSGNDISWECLGPNFVNFGSQQSPPFAQSSGS